MCQLPLRKLVIVSAFAAYICLSSIALADVVWSDEFDGDTIDLNKWTYDVGTGSWGWGNGELENYTARSENAYIEDGSLVIEARRENYNGSSFTSARLKTIGRMSFTYGTLEARIKIPDLANGLWPAFWLLGDNIGSQGWPKCGEVDILEMGMAEAISAGTQNKRHNSGAFWDYQDNLANYALAVNAPAVLNDDYHLYKLEWSPNALIAYVDNVQCWAMTINNPESSSLEEFHRPMHILLNLAVGGQNFVDITDPAAITAPLPARMYIDWVRLSDNGFTQLQTDNTVEHGNFGIFTETTSVENQVNYGTDADLYIWNNMNAAEDTPFEGDKAWAFSVAAGNWWGMGVACSVDRNMNNYSDGYLHLNMKTASTQTFRIGISSTAAGEGWLSFVDGAEQFGLVRDGSWHEVLIPLNRFANVDFPTINQLFMIAGDSGSAFDIAFDNVYWSESLPRPVPANGSYGIFTENSGHQDAGAFELGSDGNFFIWENTLVAASGSPFDGENSIALQSAPGLSWFGAAFTANIKHNLTAFRYPESRLHFAMKTSSTASFQVGIKSGNVDDIGQKWITFQNGNDPYGFARDGNWHEIDIPMSDIAGDVDLSQVSQIFEILGVSGPIGAFEIDDICFTGGGEPILDDSESNRLPTVSITCPIDNAVFAPASDIIINASASDIDGVVTKVEFYEGDKLLAADYTEPYSFTWQNVVEGTYTITAKATDDEDAVTTSSSVRVFVGNQELAAIEISPLHCSLSVGDTEQFTASGLDQYNLPVAADIAWSVSGGGSIDNDGLFTASYPGGPFVITAKSGSVTANVNVTVSMPAGVCTGGPANGDYTYEVSGDNENPTFTFIPGYTGVGDSLVLLYYGNTQNGVFPGVFVKPNKPYSLTAAEGETVYFYYTYSVPEGGQRNTSNERHFITVGQCGGAVSGDITGDGYIDLDDLGMLAYYWLRSDCNINNDYCLGADTQPDSKVNLLDLASISAAWLQ